MAQKAIQRKERINKVLSILLVYALFFQEFIPFARSMNSIDIRRSEVPSPFFDVTGTYNDTHSSEVGTVANEVLMNKSIQSQQISMRVTGGPGQSESSGFSLGSTDGLVDKFTGDFSYSIPLMSVEGYPIVLNYNSNIGMNTDASWVGLGWDLNVGSVSREMRGLPDEFNGEDKVVKTVNQWDNYTEGSKGGGFIGWTIPKEGGFSGIDKFQLNYPTVQLTALFGSYYSTYQGNGKTFDLGLQAAISVSDNIRFGPDVGLGYSRDTKNGVGRNGSIGLSVTGGGDNEYSIGDITYSKSHNSRRGVVNQSIGLGAGGWYESTKVSPKINGTSATLGVSTSLSYGSITSVPSIRYSGRGDSFRLGFTLSNSFEKFGSKWTVGMLTQSYTSDNYISFVDGSSQEIIQDAYGYLHAGKYAVNDGLAIMDFNRTNDFQFSSEMKNLAFSFQTYDIFRVSALGMGGTFRAHRTDIGTYSDPSSENVVNGNGIDLSFGTDENKAKIGIHFSHQDGDSESGNWEDGDFTSNGTNIYSFNEEEAGVNFDASTYFQALGESTPVDITQLNLLGGSAVAYLDVNKTQNGNEIAQSDYLKVGGSGGSFQISANINAAGKKPIVKTCFGPKTALQAAQESTFYASRNEGEFTTGGVQTLNRIDGLRNENHISQIDIISADGMHYTYGIPTYDIETNQVSFAVGSTPSDPNSRPVDPTTNLVRYETLNNQADNSIDNIRGRGHEYDKTTMPAYAHSFLLTEMRSSDYVDIGNNGPTVNDIGSYYKFHHTQYYGEKNIGKTNEDGSARREGNYLWRFPISDDQGKQAMHNEAFEGTELDDMANYTFGEKEIWYTHSVESKNFIAEFYLEDRKDAYGVVDEDGQLDVSAPLKKLAKIVLYNRAERIEKGDDAIPLQTVEFSYNYSLCKKSPANKHTYNTHLDYNQSGKLTLQEIRIYSGNSKEGGLSKYRFYYSSINPNFSYADIDGWGNYKPNELNRPNHIFPYSEQDPIIADANIQAWKLVAINNPMGGRVEIDYEADEYVTVQNKRTMKHLDIYGMTNLIEFLHLDEQSSWNGSESVYSEFRKVFGLTGLPNYLSSKGYSSGVIDALKDAAFTKVGFAMYAQEFGSFEKNFVPNNVILFKLDENIDPSTFASKSDANAYVKNAYFANSNQPNDIMEQILFKTHVNVKTEDGETIQEYIPAFVKISKDYENAFSNLVPSDYDDGFEAIGVMPPVGGMYEYGYVVVDPVNSGSRERKSKEGKDTDGVLLNPIQRTALDYVRQNLPDKVYGSCNGCDPELSIDNAVFWGDDVYEIMIEAGYVPSFDNDYSTMRLYVQDSVKFGGDARVSKITYKDNWNVISNEYASSYSWSYGYSDRSAETGVASYEPQAIIDESPFYHWDTYVNTAKKFPDETLFTPTPITGALFPIPSVGYADVRVKFDGAEDYGYSKAEFYTAADYPTIQRVATIDKSHVKKRNVVLGNSTDLFGFAQGFVIETNDFHGKPKQFSVLDNFDNVQSRSTYIYNDLDEEVYVMDRDGTVESERISMEYDIHADSRFVRNLSRSIGAGVSFKFAPFFIFPTLSYQQSIEGFFSSTVIKHINHSAIVKRIETEYLNSINTAENLLYDKYTGNVLLSSLTDEYEDKLYSMSYPSHWYHRELRDVCSAENRLITNMSLTGATLDLSTASEDIFAVGDQIKLQASSGGSGVGPIFTAWILSIDGNNASLINDNGTVFSGIAGTVLVRIVQSGRKNRLMETIQSVTTKRPIIIPQSGAFTFPEVEILSSSAISYRYKNNMRCYSGEGDHGAQIEVETGSVINPFDYGLMGDLVLDGQFAWQSERVNATHANSNDHKTRFDGYYEDYVPLYKLGTDSKWYKLDESSHLNNSVTDDYQKWRKLGEVTRYDEYGKAIESQDQIKVRSTVLYGFNKELGLLPVAQAVNARQQEIAFDGFEDYDYYSTNPLNVEETHFDFLDALVPGSVAINNSIRHSGLSSLEISAGFTATVTKDLADGDCLTGNEPVLGTVYTAYPCLCVAPFAPTEGDYILGAWVKVGSDNSTAQYSNVSIQVYVGGQLAATVIPSGPILDGWQRMEGEFAIPNGASGQISIILNNDNNGDQAYFDDLRVHPFLAGMTTTVYDPATLLPMATHDGYNFTTFFNYDENLNQVRVRVETLEGIKTISETEFGGQKSFNSANQ